MTSPTVKDIQLIDFPKQTSAEAALSVYEPPIVPYPIARVFVVSAAESTDRGAHAHKDCHQLLVCLTQAIDVKIKDGKNEIVVHLDDTGKGLLVPAGLWAEQTYQAGATLMVLASHTYNELDYIRNYDDYLSYSER